MFPVEIMKDVNLPAPGLFQRFHLSGEIAQLVPLHSFLLNHPAQPLPYHLIVNRKVLITIRYNMNVHVVLARVEIL